MFPELKTHPLLKIVNNAVVDLPTPSNINSFWNLGSLLGLCLALQLTSGIFLAMYYIGSIEMAFASVSYISRDVKLGWFFRMAHANGASFFFICLYSHIFRGLYYQSYKFTFTWASGVMILLALQATAFLGYVLPWGQMSFWGATVITNLVSSIPGIGESIVIWLWGGFAVDKATLTRFFALHYLLPFIISALVGIHLLFLHQTGSNNPLGLKANVDKIMFHPYYIEKDVFGFLVMFVFYLFLVFWHPYYLGDPENFLPADPLVTPVHIQPEWYFLFAYAILRAIPNKLGGVLALVFAIIIFLILIFEPSSKFQSLNYYPLSKFYLFSFFLSIVFLTVIGAKPVEEPYITFSQILSAYYFSYFFFSGYLKKLQDQFIY